MKSVITDPWRRDFIARHVLEERWRQDQKWGEQNHENGTGSESDRADAEIAKSLTDAFFRANKGDWKLILNEEVHEAFAESDPEKLRAELIQVAAVTMAWIECIDRRRERSLKECVCVTRGPCAFCFANVGKTIPECPVGICTYSRSTSPDASAMQSEEQRRQDCASVGKTENADLSVASNGGSQQDVTGSPLERALSHGWIEGGGDL
jgi:hypothetical protein